MGKEEEKHVGELAVDKRTQPLHKAEATGRSLVTNKFAAFKEIEKTKIDHCWD